LVALIQTIILSAVFLIALAGLFYLTLVILAPRIDSPHLAPALKIFERVFCNGVSSCQSVFKLKDIVTAALGELGRHLPAKKDSKRIDRH
jgi:hypothetical protein